MSEHNLEITLLSKHPEIAFNFGGIDYSTFPLADKVAMRKAHLTFLQLPTQNEKKVTSTKQNTVKIKSLTLFELNITACKAVARQIEIISSLEDEIQKQRYYISNHSSLTFQEAKELLRNGKEGGAKKHLDLCSSQYIIPAIKVEVSSKNKSGRKLAYLVK